MFKQSLFKLIFVSTLMFVGVTAKAGVIPLQATIKAKYTPTLVPVVVGSTSTVSVSPMTDPSFNDVSVLNFVTFSVKDSAAYLPTTGNIVVGLKVESYNKNNVLFNTDYPSMEIKYQPFPSTGLPYVDKSVKKYTGAYSMKVTVQSMTINGSAVASLPENLVITSDIFLERYINFTSNISTPITMNSPSKFDLDCDFIDDEVEIKWATLTGAEEYQLEWAFVNDYDKDPMTIHKSPSELSYDFRNNSTRVTTTKTSYKINLNFQQGYLIYRVRGIGRDFTSTSVPLPGAWNVANSGTVDGIPSSNSLQLNPHEENKNWQYSATYAEEGKKKEVISYFDGSLRNRQSVTKINTDATAIVGETIYDHQGRPAVNILPAPVRLPLCVDKTAGLHYYPNLNRSVVTSTEYSRADFDMDKTGDSCSSKLSKMDNTLGSARYYSPNNTERDFPQADLLPDAYQYPFSQTEYTPDNTGRIRRQGGVGGRFQLDSGHATSYYYGSPTQQQLDRLFGSEVGDASHYKKNVVRDANEQYSVTYLDQEGRTVATALAGDGPGFMDTLLTPNKNTGLLNVDLLNKDMYGISKKNTVSVQGDAIEFGTPILVSFPNSYVFNYDIKIAQFPSGCLKAGVCFNCIYDLEIIVKDDCGRTFTTTGTPVQKMIGRFTVDGGGNVSFNTTCVGGDYTNAQTFTLSLIPGNYMITKKLTVNKAAKEYYLGKYFETTNTPVQGTYVNLNPACGIKTYQQFVDAALTKIDTTDCNISCATCVASLKGSYATIELARDGFVADGKGTELDFDYLIEQCNSPCKEIGVCEGGYRMMLMDVSPDGQYGEFRPKADGTPADMNLSVYNIGNRLPKTYTSTPHYKKPSIVINGNTYAVYLEKNGVRTKINVAPKSPTDLSKGFTPEVDDNTLVKFDPATQSYYTYPENLKYLADFISKWDENWATSLVSYHPEYPYYISCLDNTKKYAGYSFTSDTFDSVLVSCKTFAQAQSAGYGLLNTIVSSDMILFNKATTPIVKDPFAFNVNFGTYSDLLNAQILNYRGTGLKMQEYAAKVARCGTMYNEQSLPPTCTGFGTTATTTVLDNEWNILKNLYLSTKRELQKMKDESYARSQKAYNGCFGNPNFDPVTGGMLSSPLLSSPFANFAEQQPCGFWLKQFYVDKKKRFGINNAENSDLPTKEENDYQMFLQTGQTPMERNVQGMLNKLASAGVLTNLTNQPLKDYPEFTQDLYVAVTGSLPTTYISYFWKATVGTDLTTEINNGSIIKSSFTFTKSSSAFTWADVKGISQFKYVSGSGPTYNFKAVAAVANPIGSIRPYTYYDITGTTNFVLNNYNPTPSTLSKCKPNQLALDLASLWTAIGLLSNPNSITEITLGATDYASFITTSIKNALGTTSTSLKWKCVIGTPNKYELYDVPAKKIVIQIDSGNTTNYVYFANMKNLDTPNGNAFRVTGKNISGVEVGKMKGSVNLDNNSVITPINLGDCGLPTNALCTGNEYQTVKDVLKLLKSVMLPKPFNTNPDLTKSPAYTPLLESYLGASVQSSTTKYDYLTLNASNDYKEQIAYNMLCKCQIRLSHKGKGNQIIKFQDLASLDSLKPYGPANIDNNKYKFYLFASYTYMSTTVRDTILGESCFPMRNCDKKYFVDTVISPVKPYVNPCIMNQLNIAALNAQNEFKKYKDSLLTDISAKYTQHCLGAFENLKTVYRDKEYHYTLYYYDQAGNLVKTIPPEGVELDTAYFAILKDRALNRHDHFTAHRMATTYTYNSLNQLVRQNVPDQDQMNVWEYTLSNGLDSRLKVSATQFVSATKGYLTGYIDFTSPTFNRGYLYTTDDGGVTWTRMKNMVASDLKKVQMVSATVGYAVGTNGIVMKTSDGGATWDMTTSPAATTFNDLYFNPNMASALNGVVLGDNGKVYQTKDGGTTWADVSSGLPVGVSLTAITYDGGTFAMTGNLNGNGYIFRVDVGSFGTGSFNLVVPWITLSPTTNTGIRSADLVKINLVDANRGFAIAKDGNLLKTTDKGLNWSGVPTGIANEFRDISFLRMTAGVGTPLYGVAIIDSIPGKGLLYQTADGGLTWKQLSPNDGNYYNAIQATVTNRDKLYAVGTRIKRIVYKSGNFSLVNVPLPVTAAMNLKTVYFGEPNKGWVAEANKVYYTSNAMSATPTWTTISTGSINIKKIYFDNAQNVGMLLTPGGSLYKITPSGGTYIFTLVSTASDYFMDITAGATRLYAMTKISAPNVIRSVAKTSILGMGTGGWTTPTPSGTVTSGNAANFSTFDVDSTEAYTIIGGADGRLFQGLTTPTTVAWMDYSRKFIPLPLYDIESPGNSVIYAVGADGTLLQCVDRNTYRVVPTGTAVHFTGIKFNQNGFSAMAAVKGLIVGKGGLMTRLDVTATNALSMIPVKSITTADLTDIAIKNNSPYVRTYVSGSGGTLISIPDLAAPAPVLASPKPANDFNGVSFNVTAGAYDVVTAGTGTALYNYSGTSGAKLNGTYTPGLYDVSFVNERNGYVVGDKNTIRYTSDGGATWRYVAKASAAVMNAVATYAPGRAVIVGASGYVGRTDTTTVTDSTVTGTYYDVEFSGNSGYMVGTSALKLNVTSNLKLKYSTTTGFPASTTFRSVHIFRNGSCIAAGDAGKIYRYHNAAWLSLPLPGGITPVLRDIFFHDDRNGYVAGDGGILYRWSSVEDVTWYPSAPSPNAWTVLSLSGTNGAANPAQTNVTTIGFADRYKGFIGGYATTGTINFARVVNDESKLFTARFWYDALGRMVLSQNTKQYNRRNLSTQSGRSDYSYTFYDALGRIVEVGEKTDNATGTTFAQIFGDYVNGRYNPYVINATNFSSWANAASPAPQRREVTRTYYDVPLSSVPSGVSQENLRKRVSVVSYEEVNDNDPLTYQNATYYSYDIHGNVKTLWQHNKALTAAVPTQVTKRMDYEYDLISGKVNLVRYQDGAPDCFYHYYMYDGDNRITDVYTSNYPWNGQPINSRFVEKNPLWSKDAKYFYYAHGPLARVEVGEFMSQGMDYAYTLQGWIKGVNSDALTAARDMGRDGDVSGANKIVGRDAFGYSLNYYQGDYSAIEATRWSSVPNRFESGRAGSQLFGARADLYNGNISAMVTNISQPKVYSSAGNEFPTYQAQGGAYTYDKLNRIKQAKYYQNLNTTTNQWNTSGLSPARYLNTFVYDGNGNILHQYRLDGGGSQIDSLSYKYSRDANGKLLKNRLNYVRDASTSLPATAADDLENQTSVLNYRYDELGNLSRDSIEQIDTIKWTVYGKIKSIRRMLSSTKSNWEFVYDAAGNRIAKIEKPDGTAKENGASDQPLQWKTTYYVRDAQGNVMGNYYYTNPGGAASYKLLERSVYGSARLGTENTQLEMIGAPGPAIPFTRTLGNKYFEASNHLGNVLVIFTDKKIPRNDDGNAIIDYFQPEVLACNDYTAFGAPMNERTFSSNKYRYGFNGQEKDDEVKGSGNSYTAEFWQYDPRLGRRLNMDPVIKAFNSPYSTFSDNPIWMVDPKGNTDFYSQGTWIGTDGKNNGLMASVSSKEIKNEIMIATSQGLNAKDYHLNNGDVNLQFKVVHHNILEESSRVLDKAISTKADMLTEHVVVLTENSKGGYDNTFEQSSGKEVVDSDGKKRVQGAGTPPGTIRIHSHPIGTALNKETGETSYGNALQPSGCDPNPLIGGDKCADADYKMNIIVGKNGVPPSAVNINNQGWKPTEDTRELNINFFGSDSQLKFSISNDMARKMLSKDNVDRKLEFQGKQATNALNKLLNEPAKK